MTSMAAGPLRRAFSILAAVLAACVAVIMPCRAESVQSVPSAESSRLPDWFVRELARLQIPPDAVSLYARDVRSGDELLSHNAQLAVRPASTIKLLTSLLAFEVLGAEPAFRTEFYLVGRGRRLLHNGQFEGDLLVRGSGDPTLDSARLEALAKRLVKRGVRTINGDLVLDTSNFPARREDEARFHAEVEAPFSAPPLPLMVNGKTVTLVVRPEPRPDSPCGGVSVALEPALSNVRLEHEMGYTTQPCDSPRDALEITAHGSADEATIRVAGMYPLACGEFRRNVSVLGAEAYFAAAFGAAYRAAGGTILGGLRLDAKGIAAGKRKPFESIVSSTTPEIVREVNKQSNNLWAQQLFLRVGAQLAKKSVDAVSAAGAIDEWLREHLPGALPAKLESGAGLSIHERLSARGLVEILQRATGADYAASYFDTLSVVGVDGTAALRMRDTPLVGRARVKTGTVSDARGLAGRLESANGRNVLFAILINHPRAANATGLIDRLAERLFAGNPARK